MHTGKIVDEKIVEETWGIMNTLRVTYEMNRNGRQNREMADCSTSSSYINYLFNKEQRIPLDRKVMIRFAT